MLFYVHGGLMILMCCFIVTAAIIAMKRADGWLMKHRMFAILGVLCGLLGAVSMFANKVINSWPHFKTPHAIMGGIAVLLLLATPTLGYLTTKGKKLGVVHKWFGRTTALLAFLVLIKGLDYLYDKIRG